MIDDDSWLMGFFEGQTSFAVNIGLTSTKNRRYVVFKPYITIVSVDDYQVKFIMNFLGLESKISKKKKQEKYYNDYYSLNIQNFDDIDKILNRLLDYDFKSQIKQEKLVKFIDCYNLIKEYGHIHTKWDDKFNNVIEKKLTINQNRSNIDKNRFGKDEWVKKIKEHLKS